MRACFGQNLAQLGGMLPNCPHCKAHAKSSSGDRRIIRAGKFRRSSDCRWIQRFRCKSCGKYFSHATTNACVWQKKRQFNHRVSVLLNSGVSERRIALIFGLNRKTIARKITFLGTQAKSQLTISNGKLPLCCEVEFDDMETFEHSKLKRVAITVMVEFGTRRFLGLQVSQLGYRSSEREKAIAKYGIRKDQRKLGRQKLFERVKPFISDNALFRSDSDPHYPPDLKKFFPGCSHETVKSRRARSTGYGELKKGGHDPIFSVNHSCAKIRDDNSALKRRTWSTSKKAERLALRLAIYAVFHNRNFAGPEPAVKRNKKLI